MQGHQNVGELRLDQVRILKFLRKLQGHQNVGELRQMTQVTKINILRLQGHQNVGELRLCEEHEVISSMIAGSPECW